MEVEDSGGGHVSSEDEVTFLLRLKPTPTPPLRRRRPCDESKQTVPKGWDVVIERQDSPTLPSPSPRRLSLDDSAPPLPPRLQPSAPPQEMVDNIHWRSYCPYPDFSSSYPNLHYYPGPGGEALMCRQDLINVQARNSQSFTPILRNSGCADLISSYSVLPPLVSPGFHVNAGKPPLSPTPTRPPKPQPRTSLLKEETTVTTVRLPKELSLTSLTNYG